MESAGFESVIINRPNLRTAFPADFAERLVGRTVQSLQRRGKYLLASLSSGEILVMHLGMSGSFRVNSDADLADPHDHVVFQMSSGATIVFNDPRRFGFMDLVTADPLAARRGLGALGPEPLSDAFDAAALAKPAAARRPRSKQRCPTSASSPDSATSTWSRRCTAPTCHRGGARPRLPREAASPVRPPCAWHGRSRRCWRMPFGAVNAIGFASTTAKASAARLAGATASSSASRSPTARRSTVRFARDS